jgi:cell wall assembly regulator SMI1
MKRIEDLSYLELIDLLADLTANYTRIVKDQRNSDQHLVLRERINELISQIDNKKKVEGRVSDKASDTDRIMNVSKEQKK